jgi:glycosyltransferase involved in cell wall biosynthesis
VNNCNYSSIEEKYKTAKGLIVSSLREGGPRVVLEAINHEVPILGTRVGIIPELISNEFLTEPNNLEALQAMLEEMVPLLPQIDMSGIKSALVSEYSIKNASKKTRDVYLSLAKANS